MIDQLTLYNSITRKKEVFQPIHPPFVGLYVCGPTVYNDVHLGNVRTFISFDVVYRYLLFLGYKVRYVRNITDVGHLVNDSDEGEDKVEKRARLEKLEPMEIVQKYTNGFHDTVRTFNLLPPSIEPTATGHIIEQIEMIQRIIKNGYAYEKNGSVYFDVEKYMKKYDYGRLSGRQVDELMEQTRDLKGGEDKRFFADFVLWKKASPETIMKWNSPWGEGVPGWNLECSVMSTRYLGSHFDIHGGGMDLKFPHHECEIAQSVGADGEDPVKYWMHTNMLTVNGTKMSKSLGNSFLPEELISGDHPVLEKGYSPMVIRFFMLQSHYSSTLDFSNEALQAAEKGFARLMKSYQKLNQLTSSPNSASTDKTDAMIEESRTLCYKQMNDDFNTAKTIAVLFDMASMVNKIHDKQLEVSSKGLETLSHTMKAFVENVLGLSQESSSSQPAENMDDVVQILLSLREDARKNKDWATSDKIRDELAKASIIVKDGKEGSSWEYSN